MIKYVQTSTVNPDTNPTLREGAICVELAANQNVATKRIDHITNDLKQFPPFSILDAVR